MPLTATGKYDVEVGRVRQSLVFGSKGLELFVCGDQLLRGAASNAVFIAEAVLFPERYRGGRGEGTGGGGSAFVWERRRKVGKVLRNVGLLMAVVAVAADVAHMVGWLVGGK